MKVKVNMIKVECSLARDWKQVPYGKGQQLLVVVEFGILVGAMREGLGFGEC